MQWPMLLDMSPEECKRTLRKMELTAFSEVVSAFRGQGELNKEKRRQLQDLALSLGITADRQRAEMRRAANDETLNTIAELLVGPGTRTEWAVEGRRVVPPLPRGRPVTAYTSIADTSQSHAARLASSLLPAAQTRTYEPVYEELPCVDLPVRRPSPILPPTPSAAAPAAPPPAGQPHHRPPSPTPGVIRLPSGMSIQLDEEMHGRGRKRHRSSSACSDSGARMFPPTPHARLQPPPSSGSSPNRPAPPPSSRPPPPSPPVPNLAGPRPLTSGPAPPPAAPAPSTATASSGNSAASHKFIFVSTANSASSTSGSHGLQRTPLSTVSSDPTPLAPEHTRRPRPLPSPAQIDPNLDAYRQLAGPGPGTPSTPGPVTGRPRQRGAKRSSGALPASPGVRGPRVSSGMKIITQGMAGVVSAAPVAAGGAKVVTKGSGGQQLFVLPSGTGAGAARTAAAGRVVTVSSGPGRYTLPRAVHLGRAPASGVKHTANVIVLQKASSGRHQMVIRPSRQRAGDPHAIPTATIRPLVTEPEPTAEVVPLILASAGVQPGATGAASTAATATTAAAEMVKQTGGAPSGGNSMLSDILHATGIIVQKPGADGGSSSSAAAGPTPPPAVQKRVEPGRRPATVAPPEGRRRAAAPPESSRRPAAAPAEGRRPAMTAPPESARRPLAAAPSEPARRPAAAPPAPQNQQAQPQPAAATAQPQQCQTAAPPAAPAPAASDQTMQSLTLEEAIDLLTDSASPEEARQILKQVGIHMTDSRPASSAAGPSASGAPAITSGSRTLPRVTVTSAQPLRADSGMELVGELDPQTGIFYPVPEVGPSETEVTTDSSPAASH